MGQKEEELLDTDNSVVMGRGQVEVEKGIGEINGNRKKKRKLKLKKIEGKTL